MTDIGDFLATWRRDLAIPDGIEVAEPEPGTRQAQLLPILLRWFLILCSNELPVKIPKSRCLDRVVQRLGEYKDKDPAISRLIGQPSFTLRIPPQMPNPALANVDQLYSNEFIFFMLCCNLFAAEHGLRIFTNWSKVWEYPWLWYNSLEHEDWNGKRLLDLGSEISPMPWFLASLGAAVTLTETDPQWIPVWQKLRQELNADIDWHIVRDERTPLRDESVDAVTSFSVIEHQLDKRTAVHEVSRVLNPGGLFALSFDICEPEMGMTFPEWNGTALTIRGFEDLVWNNPAFNSGQTNPPWDFSDNTDFVRWNLRAAPHHNYTVGAATLRKRLG